MLRLKRVLINKIRVVVFLIIFLSSNLGPVGAYPGSLAVDFLMEIGKNFYERGDYQNAIHEFRNILVLYPYHNEAVRYIDLIEKRKTVPRLQIPQFPLPEKRDILLPELRIDGSIRDKLSLNEEVIKLKQAIARLEDITARIGEEVSGTSYRINGLMREEGQDLSRGVAELKQENMELRKDLDRLSKETEVLNSRLKTGAQDLYVRNQELEQMKRRHQELNATIEHMEADLSILKKENEELKHKEEKITQRVTIKEEDIFDDRRSYLQDKEGVIEEYFTKIEREPRRPLPRIAPVRKSEVVKEAEAMPDTAAVIRVSSEPQDSRKKAETVLPPKEFTAKREKPVISSGRGTPGMHKAQTTSNIAEVTFGIVPSTQEEIAPPLKVMVWETEEPVRETEEPVRETQEPIAVIIPSPAVIQRKGEIGLFIDGREVYIEKPIVAKENKLYFPLKEIASNLYFSTIDSKEGNFRIISPQGISKDIKVSFIDAEPMITDDELRDFFSVDTYYDAPAKAFHIRTKFARQVQAYTVEKSPEELKMEERLLGTAEASLITDKPESIPEAARPSVTLRGNMSYTHIDYHVSPTYHSLLSSFTGRAYDFDLRYESLWKDINGVFDHDYTYLNLVKPGLFIGLFDQYTGLYPLRLQSQTFTGLKVRKEWENLNKTTLVAGKTDNSVSGSSGSVKYLGKIYGIEEEFVPWEWLGLKGAVLYLNNRAEVPGLSGTSSFPRNNIVSFAEAALRLPYDLTLSTQLARCIYNPDNEPDTSVEGWDWRIGSEMNKLRYRLSAAYEYVGDRYASLGDPASYRDYSGWNLYGSYKATDNWSLSSYFTRYNNNVDDDPAKIKTDNLNFSLSSYHRVTPRQTMNLSFTHFISNPSGPDPGLSSKSDLYRIDYFMPFLFDTHSILNYQYYRSDYPVDANDYYTHTIGGSLFSPFGRGSSWFISQQFIKTFYNYAASDNISSNTSLNINYVLTRLLSLYFNSSYTRNKTDLERASDVAAAATGFKYHIFPDTNLNFEYNINSYNLKTEKDRWPRNWSIMAYISQGFDLSTPPNFGFIEGWVFKDLNANGKVDYQEPGVRDASLHLEDKREAVTGPDGYYRFSYVAPGKQKIYLNLDSLSNEWMIQTPEREVDVRARRGTKVNFLLVKASFIKGKVFVDNNLDLTFQATEEPLDDIRVMLSPGEQIRWTDTEGEFKFDYLVPGKYKVRINPDDIPTGYELVSKEEIELESLAGRELTDVVFVVRLKPAIPEKS